MGLRVLKWKLFETFSCEKIDFLHLRYDNKFLISFSRPISLRIRGKTKLGGASHHCDVKGAKLCPLVARVFAT